MAVLISPTTGVRVTVTDDSRAERLRTKGYTDYQPPKPPRKRKPKTEE